jgi:hypothetical protein
MKAPLQVDEFILDVRRRLRGPVHADCVGVGAVREEFASKERRALNPVLGEGREQATAVCRMFLIAPRLPLLRAVSRGAAGGGGGGAA